ncbi:MAG: hypothetical protein HY360_08270 [Verrucomicrobia bacterium]|nr:hypothetical protein [Verrucomicrobiota bacterium]
MNLKPVNHAEDSHALLLPGYDGHVRNRYSASYFYGHDIFFYGFVQASLTAGLGACCRGTTHVSDPQSEYYRTRPLGWYEGSLFAGALASRVKDGETCGEKE